VRAFTNLFVLRGFEQIGWNFAGGPNAAIG
jgi:hypothetical protein